MTSIDRTAYPRFTNHLNQRELKERYSVTIEERLFISQAAKGSSGRLTLAILLKARQQLGYFPSLNDVPLAIQKYLATVLDEPEKTHLADTVNLKKTRSRYRISIRAFLHCRPYIDDGPEFIKPIIATAAHTMSDPADLINIAIDELVKANIDLPAFSTLDRLVNHLRQQVHEEIFVQATQGLSEQQQTVLTGLLRLSAGERLTGFTRLKQSPGTPTITRIREWSDRLDWLTALPDPAPFLKDIAFTKIRQFAAEASANEISDIRNMRNERRRHTLLLCLLYQAQSQARDDLVKMFLRRMKKTENAAKEKLALLQQDHRAVEESLIAAFARVLDHAGVEESSDACFGRDVRNSLQELGGVEHLKSQHENVSAFHKNNYMPLMRHIHARHRSLLFRLLDLLAIGPANQDESLLKALEFVRNYRLTRRDFLPFDIDLSFASERWKKFVSSRNNEIQVLDRRALEVCVFWHVAEELHVGNLYVEGSEEYQDYRTQLLPWEECERRLPAYCAALGLPETPQAIVAALREELETVAAQVDAGFPDNTQLSIDPDGKPHLKRQKKAIPAENLEAFQKEVRSRLPERHLLDILKHTNHWTGYTRHFGPPSGSSTKMSEPTLRYLFTLFGYGCFLGPNQTERHAPLAINRQTLRRINAQHISAEKLEAALKDLINEYARFQLPECWGKGKAAITDGTHIELVENNLVGAQHIRYGGYGGIAYHHIADNYVALFCNFIVCGVWEGAYIFDGLLKNTSTIQPDTLHADTHGQSEPAFALAHLLGIKLFPRMRTWHDVTFYRPGRQVKYEHIDALFTDVPDWDYMEQHVRDMLQVVLSIQAGMVLPSMLLQKLSTRSRKNKLYRAFREFGRVRRTIFLLRYISDADFRFSIRAETTKIESFHDFMDWIAFGGNVIKSGDPVEHSKRMKYLDVIANAIMLQNVSDLTDVLIEMANEDWVITQEHLASLSPYVREHILRFGRLSLDMDDTPEPLQPRAVPVTETEG